MNIDIINFILLTTIKYAVIVPVFIMCAMPFTDKCKFNHKVVLLIGSAVLIAISLIFSFIKYYNNVRLIYVLPVFLAVTYILYFAFYNVPFKKRLYVYVSCIALFSFTSLISYIFEAYTTGGGVPNDTQKIGLIAQWCIIAIFFIIYKLSLPKIKWLLSVNILSSVWDFVWFVPVLFIVTNVSLIPYNYANVFLGHVFEVYTVTIPVFFIFFVLFQIMLYTVAKTATEKVKVQQQSQLLSVQAKEYGNLKKYIEETSHLRHDFLHMARAAGELAKNNETEALIKLLDEYGVSLDASHTKKIFCENTALNAILGYYYDEAVKKHIKCDWKIVLPNTIGVLDTDLCSVVGNILNNAIQGCDTISEEKRSISLIIDVEKSGDIYIIVTNSFDGVVNKKDDKYFTTKKDGSGIGITSVRSIVDKYDGYISLYNVNKNFYTDIMMKQK